MCDERDDVRKDVRAEGGEEFPLCLLYFAWVAQEIGCRREEVCVPLAVGTISALLDWLRARGGGYARALTDIQRIRVALNQEFVPFSALVSAGDEVAIFPPVTGG